jgi:hypothetical protein
VADIFEFSCTLGNMRQKAFLIVFSVLCWTLWKHCNEKIFNQTPTKSTKSLILLIISVCEYWTGNMDRSIRAATAEWLLEELNIIPLRVWDPNDNQLVVYQGAPKEMHGNCQDFGGGAGCPAG